VFVRNFNPLFSLFGYQFYSGFNLNELLTYAVLIVAGVQALPALAGKACTPAMLWKLTEFENAVNRRASKTFLDGKKSIRYFVSVRAFAQSAL